MRNWLFSGLFAAASLTSAAAGAQALPTNPLGECMKLKSTGQDRLVVARWMIAAIASAPQVKDVVSVDPGVKAAQDRALAQLFTRLVTRDCAEESRASFKAKSSESFQTAGGVLGQIAIQELLSNREASAALEAFTTFLKEEDFLPLRK